MPMQRELYPADWEAIALRKKESVSWKCEGCGLQCRKPGEPFDTQKRTLTVHHPHFDKGNPDAALEALCVGCHLRADLPHHMENAAKTRQRKRIERGQMALEVSP